MIGDVTFFEKGDYIRSVDQKELFRLEEPLMQKWISTSRRERLLIGKAYDVNEKRVCFLKVTNDPGKCWAELQREVRFKFFYPYIEHTYEKFCGVAPNGKKIYGVCVEYIYGKTLTDARIELHDAVQKGILSEEEEEKIVFRQMLELLLGMECYMEQTVDPSLHRDIKDENIMVVQDVKIGSSEIPGSGHVKIVDFDFSHASNSHATIRGLREQNNNAPGIGGTGGFISPYGWQAAREEKCPGKIDEIYSAGRVFFFLLNNGEYYFTGEDIDNMKYAELGYEELGYGMQKERFVSRSKYKYIDEKTGDFKQKYKGLIAILKKMCCNPKKEEPYLSVTEVIEDMLDFLEAYYGSDKYEACIGLKEMPLLQASRKKRNRKSGNAVPVYVTRPDEPGAGSRGRNLYEYGMRNIVIEGLIAMVIYNIGGRVSYIPMNGTVLLNRNENNEYRVYDRDIFLLKNGTKIQFSIG